MLPFPGDGEDLTPGDSQRSVVVVIDDDVLMLNAVARILEARGFAALVFPSVEAAMESGTLSSAACVVCDIVLPGMSGVQLGEQLARQQGSPPIVLMTAHDEPAMLEAATRAGAAALFIKPFSGRELVAAVAAATLANDT
jgi:FixJ family two-component response regulator